MSDLAERTSREAASDGPVDLEPLAATGREAGARRIIWLLGSWVTTVVVVAMAALAFGAVDEPEDAPIAVETITDVGGLRSAMPDTSERAQPFHMTMEMDVESAGGELPVPFGMSVDVRSDGHDSAVELTTFGRTISMVTSRDTVYLPTVDGDGWVAYRMPNADSAPSAMLGSTDPMAMLDAMSSTHPVELLGQETIDDIEVTHYRVRNDVGSLLEDTATSESQREAIEALGLGALPTMTVDAWIDTEGVLRRMDMSIEAEGSTITMVMRIDDLEEPPEITVPAGAEGPFDVDPTDPTGRFATHLSGLLIG